MAALTQAQIDALKTTLVARWNAGLKLSPDDWKKIAKLVKSNGKSNTYEWLSQFPAFREGGDEFLAHGAHLGRGRGHLAEFGHHRGVIARPVPLVLKPVVPHRDGEHRVVEQ